MKIYYRIWSVTIVILTCFVVQGLAQSKPAYVMYDQSGNKVEYSDLLVNSLQKELIFFGELHNNPISHWLQFELTRDLYYADTSKTLRLGFEMFEADQQVILDEYTSGLLTTSNFEREVRLWNNYKTDYKPLVEFGKSNGLQIIASNIPRRYASLVYSQGIESLNKLSDLTKSWIAPLPVTVDLNLPGYKDIMTAAGGHGGENLPKSQAVKDATMAHFILKYHRQGDRFIHYNGSYHSDNFEGIVWYVQQVNPDIKIMTITTIEHDNPSNIDVELLKKADYTIVVPSTMTKTY
jgi:uncharacterized iron-regulated protein